MELAGTAVLALAAQLALVAGEALATEQTLVLMMTQLAPAAWEAMAT